MSDDQVRHDPQGALAGALALAVGDIKDALVRDGHFSATMRGGAVVGYDYLTADAVMEVVRAPLAARGLALIVGCTYADQRVQLDIVLIHSGGGSIAWTRERPIDEMGGSKGNAVAAAATKALKQALRDLLLLPGADPSEAPDEQHGARVIQAAAVNAIPPRPAPAQAVAAPPPPPQAIVATATALTSPPARTRGSSAGQLLSRAGATLRAAGATRDQALAVFRAALAARDDLDRYISKTDVHASAWGADEERDLKAGMGAFVSFMRDAKAAILAPADRVQAISMATEYVRDQAIARAKKLAAAAKTAEDAQRPHADAAWIADEDIPF